MRIGIIKEGKVPIDKRVAVTPKHAAEILETYPNHEVVCQSSAIRCYTDQEYKDYNIPIVDDISHCDILIGVKEVPIPDLLKNKTYLFFSHTIKKQPYNRSLLQEILQKDIRLIDYEKLYGPTGARVVAFGRFAGIVGAYNALWTYGKRFGAFSIRRAHECHDLNDLKKEFTKVNLPPIKMVLTGGGRVSQGSMEVLDGVGIKKVSPKEFLENDFHEAVYTQLNPKDYNTPVDTNKTFVQQEFFQQPEAFKGDFLKYTKQADILIAGAYWDPHAPVLFTRNDILNPEFKIRIIADITCDIEGSIPSTLRPCTIEDPVYDYDPQTGREQPPFSNEKHLSVMAIDNLPCEVPRDASDSFGSDLLREAIPKLLEEEDDPDGMIETATITWKGALTQNFNYLQDYVDGKK